MASPTALPISQLKKEKVFFEFVGLETDSESEKSNQIGLVNDGVIDRRPVTCSLRRLHGVELNGVALNGGQISS